MNHRAIVLAAGLATALTLAACGAGDTTEGAQDGTGAEHGSDVTGELTILAAASLHTVFEEVAELFTAAHPEGMVTFSFAGSADLVAQLDAGAPADVLATADEATMAAAVANDTIQGESVIFASNALTLITPAGNPAGVTGLDESLDEAHLVVCAPHVPCGGVTETLAEFLDVELQPVSEERSVIDVLGKITSGQGDAGLVYTTDAASAAGQVEIIEVYDQDEEVRNDYPIAVTSATDQPDLAGAWVDFVLGPQAQAVLDEAGFGTP